MTATVASPRTALFIARRYELALVKSPIRQIRNPSDGSVIDKTEGEHVKFVAGRFETEDPELIEWLRGHKLCGDPHEGFTEQQVPAPELSQDEIDTMMAAATALDADALEAFIVTERDGWARPKVLELAENTLARVQAAVEQQTEPKGK